MKQVDITGKDVWDSRNETILSDNYVHKADELFSEYLIQKHGGTFLELGCVPGRNMRFFGEKYNLTVSGVDYSETLSETHEFLKGAGVDVGRLIKGDILKITPEDKYDVVFSDGLIEHFDDPACVLEKHMNFLASDGLLIIGLPNFNYGQKVLKRIFNDKVCFDIHNFDVMYPHVWNDLVDRSRYEVHFIDYFGTFQFWVSPSTRSKFFARVLNKIVSETLKLLRLDNIPNRYFSPNIYLILHKKVN